MKSHYSNPSLLVISAFLISILCIFSGCNSELHSAVAEKEVISLEEVIPVEVAPIKLRDITASHLGSTGLKARHEAAVVAEKQGILREVLVDEGQHVKKRTSPGSFGKQAGSLATETGAEQITGP